MQRSHGAHVHSPIHVRRQSHRPAAPAIGTTQMNRSLDGGFAFAFAGAACFYGHCVTTPKPPASTPAPAAREPSGPPAGRWRVAVAVIALCVGAGVLTWWKAGAKRQAHARERAGNIAPAICIDTQPMDLPRLGIMDRVLARDHLDLSLVRDPVATAVRNQMREQHPTEMPPAMWTEIAQMPEALAAGEWTQARTLPLALDDPKLHIQLVQQQRMTVAWRETLFGPVHPESFTSRRHLATILEAQGDPATAEAELRAMLAIQQEIFGAAHRETLSSRNELANLLLRQRRASEAEREYRTVLMQREQQFGPLHPLTLSSGNNLANAIDAQDRHTEAEAAHRAVLARREETLGPEHPAVLQSCANLAVALANQGKVSEAAKFAWRAESGRQKNSLLRTRTFAYSLD